MTDLDQVLANAHGTPEDKRRARIIIETVCGKRTVGEACLALGVNRKEFEAMRDGAVQAMEDVIERSLEEERINPALRRLGESS